MILKCNCKTDKNGNPNGACFQDQRYGEQNRVHVAKGVTPGKKPEYVCSVCGTVRSE